MPALAPAALAQLTNLHTHFDQCIVPLWQGPGWNAELGLPFEALDANGQPLPPQRYRAMACARQLYLFASRIEKPGAAERAAELLRSLQQHFFDAEHGGWYYSVDAQGQPLDTQKDLYTHAFILFACAHYWARSGEQAAADVLDDALEFIVRYFANGDGLYEASLAQDWQRVGSGPLQNPLMHLAEALLAVLEARHDARAQHLLVDLTNAMQARFVDTTTGVMLEKPLEAPDNWFEPGHQFEWFYLLDTSPLLRGGALHSSLSRALGHAETLGVKDGIVLASLSLDGQVIDATGRIWAQAEYLRALGLQPGAGVRLAEQLEVFVAQFVRPQGWVECRDAQGQISRPDMPSTTPYHLATCLAGLSAD